MFTLITALQLKAQSYRGFVDQCTLFGVVNSSKYNPQDALSGKFMLGFTTSHGLQVAPKLFVGAGTGAIFSNENMRIPLFAEARYDFFNRYSSRANVFMSLKLGYQIGFETSTYGDYWGPDQRDAFARCGLYYQPTVGVRIRTSRICGINLGLSYIPSYWKLKSPSRRPPHEDSTFGSIALTVGVDI